MTISTLVALGTEPQLKLHINTGFNVGLTKEKIVGALIHCIPYVGFPRVLNAPDPRQAGHGGARSDPGNRRGLRISTCDW